ncbi:MAG: MFS transporter [Phycisphaerae bacterium]
MAAAVNNTVHAREVTEALNEVKFSGFHLRAIITAGMGFFTSAYDLAIIGTAVGLANESWKAGPTEIGLITSCSLFATFIGAILFGTLADRIGRKSVYGLEAILMTVGALGSAFSFGVWQLVLWRVIMGLGIGGDYPLSAVIMSEYANRQDRGKMVGMVFSCQAIGFLAGPIVILTLLAAGVNHDLAWRIALGIGALPAAGVILLRRAMPESPRWQARAKGNTSKAAKDMANYTDGLARSGGATTNVVREPLSKYTLTLLGTAGCWFIFDYAYYGNTIGMPAIINSVAPHASMITTVAWNVIIFGLFAVPGYVLAFMFSDKLGRKFIQMMGFAMMTLMFLVLGLVPALSHNAAAFITVFGLSYFFSEFGPNVTTFVLAAELFPVNLRTTGHGISSGIAKFGAFLGVLFLNGILAKMGFGGGMLLSAGMSVIGLILTALFIKEPAGKSLEEASRESLPTPPIVPELVAAQRSTSFSNTPAQGMIAAELPEDAPEALAGV